MEAVCVGREIQDEESMANLSLASAETTFSGLKIGHFTLIQNKQVNTVDSMAFCANMDLLAVVCGKQLSVYRLNWQKLMSIEIDDLRWLYCFRNLLCL